MELLVERKWKKPTYTIGRLYADGVFFSNSLEDRDRGLTQGMAAADIKAIKVPGETAIPTGRYRVRMGYSPKFRRKLPRLYDVPGYTGILIHAGNTAKDSAGCILVGLNTVVGAITNSRATVERLVAKIEEAERRCDEVWITVK